jgi:hypothetical protein
MLGGLLKYLSGRRIMLNDYVKWVRGATLCQVDPPALCYMARPLPGAPHLDIMVSGARKRKRPASVDTGALVCWGF